MPHTEPTLQELAFMYGTDKLEHGYLPFYEQYLPKNPRKLLEIGVKEGRSIQMWQKYFPHCEIHGLDLFEADPIPDIPGVKWWKGNQCDWRVLEQLRREDFDIVVDDGSHNSRDQMMTFFGLFNGKHYFIEDLHCCAQEFYRDRLPYVYTANDLFFYLDNSGNNDYDIVKSKNIILIKC
jgi:hypothetical protein